MSLPNLSSPSFVSKFISDGTSFTYRPFSHKEQRDALIVSESGTPADIINNLLVLVGSCVEPKFDWLKARSFLDFEQAFLAIRSKSIGESVDIQFRCTNTFDGVECGAFGETVVDIRDATASTKPNNTIKLADGIYIKLKPINIECELEFVDAVPDARFREILMSQIECIIDGDVSHTEFDSEDFNRFFEQIPPNPLTEIYQYFQNPQTMVLDVPTRCKKCGKKEVNRLVGAINFFG